MPAPTDTIGFGAIASTDPDRVAVIEGDGTPTTYGELARRVDRLSRGFAAHGLRPGDAVAAVLPNRRAYFELRLATGQSGLYLTPVSHHGTVAEVGYLVSDSEARLVVADRSLVDTVGAALDGLGFPGADRFAVGGAPGWTDYEQLLSGVSDGPPAEPRAGEVMGYTSGTTGRPKAVRKPLPDGPPRLSPYVLGFMARLDIRPGHEVHLAAGPLYHAAPGTFATLALQLGHTVVLAERPTPEDWLHLVERHRVSVTFTVPTMLHRLVRLPAQVRDAHDTSSLRSVVHAGAPCPPEIKHRAIDVLGPVLTEFYGATEGTATALTSAEWLTKPGSVGYPLPGIRVRVLDEDGRDARTGEAGTVYFTPAAPFEYLKDAAKTASAMHDGLFSAGDIGHLDQDGWLFLHDRRTDLVISGGVNLYPAEIEGVLAAHPAVADAAVIGVPDPEWGQRAVAIVAPEPDATAGTPLAEALIAHCRSTLAGYKVPRAVEFTDALPRTSSGKLLRRDVRDAYRASGATT
ncbi:AMP-binding protein [Pseudonocardia nantongensis]|uniref:AMP-binding protein n=1 Tax=Pseudonocardia nantongensis TaxID=1181885 RepID=UPI00397972EF